MNNIEKLTTVGKAVYGDNWQSPISRDLGIDARTIRHFIKGERDISNLSPRLVDALQAKIDRIKAAIDIVNSDKISGDDISIEMIAEIASRYEYAGEQDKKNAIDSMNNAIYEETYLADLDTIAKRLAL